jgi:hypothetical protein
MKFNLEVSELDLVVGALAALPWGQVNPLISKLVSQSNDRGLQGADNPPASHPAERTPPTLSGLPPLDVPMAASE